MYRFSYKYLLLALCMLSTLSLMGQNPPIALPADGDWPTIVGDSIMLIGPNQESLTEEQRYFNPPYLLVYPGKEHLKNDMIRAALCDCDPTQPNRRIGVFSVSGDKKVSFSQGNLQYLPAANIWKFADTQYEYLGNANKYLSPTFRNWVDLFGWSANNTTAPFGVSTSTNAADYAGDFVDWGMNEICGDMPNTWRTLSKDEWEYLINKRANAKQLCGMACVHGVNGLILLPDNWITPAGISFSSGTHAKDSSIYFAQVNDYTLEKWQLLEESGAVFLPAAGVIRIDEELRSESRASYWSSTGQGTKAYILNFHSNFIITSNEDRYGRRSVRLVHDTVLPEAVDLGLSVKWATFNIGAKAPEEFGYYFAWGETRPKDKYTWATYQWCEGTYSSLTKYCTNSHYGTVDNNATLDPEDDAATIHWKDNWRMPTNSEWAELYTNCTWTRITLNGVIGYKVTSKVAGFTNKSIFLPAAGYRTNASIGGDNNGYYWSSSLYTGDPNEAWRLYHSSSGRGRSHSINRHYGWSIRPVYGQPTCTVPTVETIPATQITDQSALVGGKVSDDGTGHIHEFGVVYSTLENPTITDNKIVGSDGMGLFVNTLADLQPHTTYYIRAYAINEHGVGYGTQESFTTGSIHPEDTTGMENGHAYVDLGLSVLWATCNIGADAPEQYGDYFAWGETQPKEKYNWSTYQWSNTDGSIITKYVTNSTYGTIDNKTLLDPEDDAAIVNWGGNWRMPTYTELTELRTQCIWVWTCENGIYGHRVTSPINGNSIFLPAAGYKSSKSISYLAFAGYYASSSLRPHLTKENFYIHFRTSYTSGNDMSRYIGLTIRPVLREHLVKTPTVTTYDATQITDTSALVSGRVTNDGGANITEHGVVFSTSKKPTIDHNKVVSHDGMSAFSCLLTQLTPNTTYYARAFATNSAGTAYGKQITIYTIDPSVSPPSGNANGYDYVDLGLSVMWATSNVGATTPQQLGDLVAWGETTTKDVFDWSTYRWYNLADTMITKYCVSSRYGFVDNIVVLDSIDDIAAHMGSKWHMPTDEEWEELRTRCTWYWSYQGGINGYKVVAPNGNSIFLPAAGYRIDTTTHDTDTIGYYWSSNLHLDFSTYARGVSFTNSYLNTFFNGRYCGQSIRPVHDTIVSQPEPKYVDLGLSVKWATFNVGATSPEDYGDYFAWGETEPKEEYSWATYKWCDGTDANMTKYNATDGKTILEPEDDAVHVNWGGKWRMPTEEEFTELREHCTWIWVEKNGINGYEITGSNGNSIFVPAAGFYYENGFNYGENGDYWSAEAGLPNNGIHLNFYPDKQIKSSSYRYVGFTIRPVYDDSN